MIRRAFTMCLKPGPLEEHTRHHNEIWPALIRGNRREWHCHDYNV